MPSATPTAQMSLFDDEVAAAATPAPADPPPAAPPPAAPTHRLPASPRARHAVVLDAVRVPYELRRGRRRSIGFTVGPEGLAVSAPRWVGQGDIERALTDKGRWILRKLHEQAERAARLEATRIEWRDGAVIPFLGESLILVVDPRVTGAQLNTAADALPGVPRLTLHLGLPQQAAPAQVRELVQGWLQRQARRVFEERCELYARRLGVKVRRIALSSATTRWGSATADGSIRLHWRLMHFALPVIDYVVTHELAHLREMNHSAAFWDVVRSVLPGYEAARVELRDGLLPDF